MSTDYQSMNLKDLKTLLKSMKVKGVSKLNKKQILALLTQREMQKEEAAPVVEEPVKKSTKKTTKKTKPTKKATPVKKETPVKEEKTVVLTDKPIEKKKLDELKYLCKQNNVKGFSKMKKKEIVSLLQFFEEQKQEFVHPVHPVFSEKDDVAEPLDVLSKMSLKDLKKLAKSYKLKKYSKLTKQDLMTLIQSRTLLTATEKVVLKLKKQNMKDLKLLCKELKVKGYSKLNKQSIVEKILAVKDTVVEEPATEEPATEEKQE